MILPDMSEVATAEQAREIAIEWQHRSAERDHSWSEVIDDANWFEALAQKFPELSDEFAENGIISAVPCLGCGSTEMPLHVDRMCPNCHDLELMLGPPLSMTKAEARETLLHLCPKGTTVYLVLEHKSQSGMMRIIKPYTFAQALPGEPVSERFLAGYVAALLDLTRPAKHDGVKVLGCGMDMGFDLVYRMGRALYEDGYALQHRWL